MEKLTIGHPRWREFLELLERRLDFRRQRHVCCDCEIIFNLGATGDQGPACRHESAIGVRNAA